MSITTPRLSAAEELASPHLATGIKKATYRLLPMLMVLYFVAFLDRTNVGFAEEAMEIDRGISAAAYALGAGIFFIGYALFEVPSNLLLKRFGARFWLARIAVSWGLVATAFAFVNGDKMFVLLRFLLGVTEAGLFPGILLLLSDWFPNRRRVQIIAFFYLSLPFSQMVGAPMSGGLISFGHAYTPWSGWQVMFFVEGMMAVIAGLIALFVLVNSPQEASFLTAQEKHAMQSVMDTENAIRHEDGPRGIGAALVSWKVWYFTVIYFCLQAAIYGITFYLPQQVSGLIGQGVGWQVGLVSAIPWLFGMFALHYVGKHAGTVRRRRRWGTALYLSTGTATFISAWATAGGQSLLGLVAITVAICSFLAVSPVTWAFPTSFLTGVAAAAGIGLINSLGNLGGFVAPLMRTGINEALPTDTGAWGIVSLGLFGLLAAAMMWCTRFFGSKADTLL
ncbi:MFS transporter [Streptomyces shenzhenensis]